MTPENEVPSDKFQSELNKTVKKYDEALRKMENEGTSEPTVQDYADARALIKKSHRANELEECMALEKNIATALSALRAEWKRENEGLNTQGAYFANMVANLEAEKQALEAEKKGLEELIKNNQGNLELERKGWTKTVLRLEERVRELEIGKKSDKDEIVKMAEAICMQANENTRLKARNEELEAENESLKGNEYHTGFKMGQEHEQIEIRRLTSALGVAHEVIGKILDDTSDWVDSSTYRRFVDDYKAKEVFQDKSGSVAFEKWKALQNTKQEYDKAMNVCLDKFSNQKFGSVADCLNGIFEKWKKMEQLIVVSRNNLNMLRYFHLDYTGGPTDEEGNRPKQPVYKHEGYCTTCNDLIAGEKALEAYESRGAKP